MKIGGRLEKKDPDRDKSMCKGHEAEVNMFSVFLTHAMEERNKNIAREKNRSMII